jgi:hypothetical protein
MLFYTSAAEVRFHNRSRAFQKLTLSSNLRFSSTPKPALPVRVTWPFIGTDHRIEHLPYSNPSPTEKNSANGEFKFDITNW